MDEECDKMKYRFKIVKRVLKSAKLCLEGHSIEEISGILETTFWTTYRDLNVRLKKVDEELYKEVIKQMSENSNDNLIPKGKAYK